MADKPGVGSSAADYEFDHDGNLTTTGAANTYAVITGRKIMGYYKGLRFCARINVTNTGASTMAVDEAGAIALRKAPNAALVADDLLINVYYDFIYDDVNNVLQVFDAKPFPTAAQVGAMPITGGTFTGNVTINNVPGGNGNSTLTIIGGSGTGNPGMELGRVDATTSTPFIDFHTGSVPTDFDSRILASGGTGADGGGTLAIVANSFLWRNFQFGSQLLTSGTVSNAATLDLVLTSYTAFKAIKFVLQSFLPATDDRELWMLFSTNGGSSYDTTSYAYTFVRTRDADTAPRSEGASGAARIDIVGSQTAGESVSNVAAEGGSHTELTLFNQTNTAVWPRVQFQSTWFGSTVTDIFNSAGAGQREVAQDTDAVRFLFETGNITSGTYAVYGLV